MRKRHLLTIILVAVFVSIVAPVIAKSGKIVGKVIDVRSDVAVTVQPVKLYQGKEQIAEVLTDALGEFEMQFDYDPDKPLRIRTASNTGYLPTEGQVEPNTRLKIKVMPRWATIMGIVTDHETEKGLADIPIHAGRGDSLLHEQWAKTKTDDTGIFMMKVPAFDGDDVTQPVTDLWLAINDGENANTDYAVVHTDTLPLWASSTNSKPTNITVSLPAADAKGMGLADVLSVEPPAPLREQQQAEGGASSDSGSSTVAADDNNAVEKKAGPDQQGAKKGGTDNKGGSEFLWVSPDTGKKYRIIIIPVE